MHINRFVKNPLIPEGMLALVVFKDGMVSVIWYGAVAEVPQPEFERSNEAHVGEDTYDRIAERAAATGKGTPVQ